MSDNLNTTPELTLTLDGGAAAQAVPEAPTLTLQPEPEAQPQPAANAETAQLQAQKDRDANAVKLDESMLSEAERKMVDEFSQKIDISDSTVVLQYGAA